MLTGGQRLVEALVGLGWEGDLRVDLELVRLEDGETVKLTGVRMTEERRNAIRDAGRREPVRRNVPASVAKADALADIDAFAAGLRDQFAYLELKGIDLEAELEALRVELVLLGELNYGSRFYLLQVRLCLVHR